MDRKALVAELESLKDAVNEDRKRMITHIQDQLMADAPKEEQENEKSDGAEKEQDPMSRREEARDAGEHEQHLAEEAGLIPKRRAKHPQHKV